MVSENVRLGTVHIPVPPRKVGEISIECRFTYDPSGILEVDVSIPETGVSRQLVIVDEADKVDDLDRRREQLAGLKFHPRDDLRNQELLARATRCYEGFTGQFREQIAQLLLEFEGVLERQDPRIIEQARAEIHRQLDELEGLRFL